MENTSLVELAHFLVYGGLAGVILFVLRWTLGEYVVRLWVRVRVKHQGEGEEE